MQGGELSTGLVTTPSAVVRVNNRVRSVERVSVTRELATDLPEEVVGTAGITAATGQIAWSARPLVGRTADNPWSPIGNLPPATGDDLYVDVGVDGQHWRQLTGTADSTRGSFAQGTVTTAVVDGIDRLRRNLTWDAQLALMPPVSELTPPTLRSAGLTALSVVDRAMRSCGFSASPAPNRDSFFSASLHGDLHADLGGELHTWTGSAAPGFLNAEWGPALSLDGERVQWVLTDTRLGPNVGFELSFQVPRARRETAAVKVVADGKTLLGVTVSAAGVSVARVNTRNQVVNQFVAGINFGRVSVRTTVADFMASTQVWLGDQRTDLPPLGQPPVSTNTDGEWQVHASGQLQIGGIVLDPISSATALPRASADPGSVIWDVNNLESIHAFPAVVGRDALGLIREAAEALCASVWLDEYNRLNWRGRERAGTGSHDVEVTSQDSLLDLAWITSSASLRREVSVRWSTPAITVQAVAGVTLWQAGEVITEGAPRTEFFIHPEGSTDWVGVDREIKYLSGTPPISQADVERGVGTFGFTRVVEGGYGLVNASIDRLDPQSYRFTGWNAVAGSRVSWQTDELFPVEAYRSQYTPYLRGRAKVEWSDTVTTAAERGPELAADLEHGAGPWVQSEVRARSLAAWLAGYSKVSHPRVESLSILPDPRIQLGDLVHVVDTDVTYLRILALVVGIQISASAQSLEQSLTLRVISATPDEATLGTHDAAWRGADLQAHDSFWTPGTLHDLDNNPNRTG